MGKYIFNTKDTSHKSLNGSECEIIRTITEPELGFDTDVLPMHKVRISDTGQELDVWPDELTPVKPTGWVSDRFYCKDSAVTVFVDPANYSGIVMLNIERTDYDGSGKAVTLDVEVESSNIDALITALQVAKSHAGTVAPVIGPETVPEDYKHDWMEEAGNGDTRLGLVEWYRNKLELEED